MKECIVITMSADTQTDRTVGRVKWFNNKAGYGFITVTSGAHTDKDIFVHYSNINVSSSQYKYLVQGEYVEFVVSPIEGGNHEFQATAITGISGGAIMCETRRDTRETTGGPRRHDGPRRRPTRPPRRSRETNEEDGFKTVDKK
jgi:cold shock CspA family protein